ncbi:hypothetical protein BO83DRAFT_376509 [Aspergillus eucalypticola CBS 122712]|uniref:Fucose-specific lectin n=1 Tax=Aspergillus eucalypticola (strain CBS 122712 / IBT 29274) TaxID=1448314 RepID=A0A317VXM4_ASPEC|nr:uncharacterized protein BO83DRAFT_376509 [Aspergillus eucalypticola CBS 122712]PWY79023.1 hypothetical protein BO83DRAFT_376509 [Aspergillus eucalypticola CBS 122712]
METTLEDIAYLLTIPTGALSRDGSTMYFVVVDDGVLVEKYWNGNEIVRQYFISEDVAESPSAKYLLSDDVRRIFFPSAENVLQCYQWDEDEEEWDEVTLQADNTLKIHPKSKISGAFNGDDQLIFFQDPSGHLQGLRIDQSGKCSALPPLLANTPKSPLVHTAYEADDGPIHVLYFDGETKVIRDLKWDGHSKWQDTIANSGECFANHEISSFVKTSSSEQDPGLLAISTNNIVLYIDSLCQMVELGTFDRKRFAAATSEECINETLTLLKSVVDKFGGKRQK